MTPGAQYQAAIDLLQDFDGSRQPLDRFISDWARKHRFAGSKDRLKIKEIVYSVMRRRAEFSWHMGDDTPRALVLAELFFEEDQSLNVAADLFNGKKYCPEPLTIKEIKTFSEVRKIRADPESENGNVSDSVRFNFPEWLLNALSIPDGSTRHHEMASLSKRAPVDLRVNTLKEDRENVLLSLKAEGIRVEPCPFSDLGIRLTAKANGGYINIRGTRAFKQGHIELQDEAMQIACLLTGAEPNHQVLDMCAGGGGKTLALAAIMLNKGQIYACDTHDKRLARIKERLDRAGVRNVQSKLISEIGEGQTEDPDFVDDLGRFDRVLLDVPCSGSGVWRRMPDAKWSLTQEKLDHYISTQRSILARAAPLVKPGGRLVYVTCSMFGCENGDQISSFLNSHAEYRLLPLNEVCLVTDRLQGRLLAEEANVEKSQDLLMSPGTTHTDGAYIAVLERQR